MSSGTRSSARLSGAGNVNSSPQSAKSNTGTKRKADDASPNATKSKRGRPSKASKEQKTLEETLPVADGEKDVEEKEVKADETNGEVTEEGGHTGAEEDAKVETNEDAKMDTEGGAEAEQNALDQVKAAEDDAGKTSKEEDSREPEHAATNGDVNGTAIEEDTQREKAQPSNVLEKGIIYFFTRGRVGVEDPNSVQDLARSYFVLRPLPDGAKITDGAVQDVGNNRLVALPKKVWPKSGKDRFMVFVEKAAATMDVLKEEFFAGSSYSTQTVGTRQTPDVTPIGEGVYAITSTGGGQGTTHLAYMLTIPTEIGEVQKDVGIAEKGSFVLSIKNPKSDAPNQATLPNAAEYPEEILQEFGGRGWMPAHPKHLNYTNTSMLIIGENFDSSSNLDANPKDEKDDAKETPQEELEKLEHEDELRVEHMKGDDTIFADLGISSKDYPKVMTTW